jgi:hypothetical protein
MEGSLPLLAMALFLEGQPFFPVPESQIQDHKHESWEYKIENELRVSYELIQALSINPKEVENDWIQPLLQKKAFILV